MRHPPINSRLGMKEFSGLVRTEPSKLEKKTFLEGSYPPEAAACRQVLPKLSGVFMSNPADSTCSLLIDETILYS